LLAVLLQQIIDSLYLMHYQKHIFMCANQKDNQKKCCNEVDTLAKKQYFKSRLAALNLHGVHKFRVSTSGCLGRCAKGPCMVIYPEGTWYRYQSESDLDKIIEQHLLADQIASELTIDETTA
jgi:(2Fe-2S) ferredoxin